MTTKSSQTKILSAAIVLGLAPGCYGGPKIEGLFNNEGAYEQAIREHQAAWTRQFGLAASRSEIEAVVRRHGGECFTESTQLVCVVDARPDWPSIFTQRHLWRTTLASTADRKFRLVSVHVDILGMDF